ncbi:hypothetical protein JTB14_027014 [Gonioctena quinquepunctata]|nr:hypothetical protein JTB14_027014 [Gonioctena quinquepunctata]
MEPARFYGSSKHVNTTHCDGSVSEDESSSDSDSDYVPSHYALRHGRSLIIPETDNDSSIMGRKILKYSSTLQIGASGFSYDFDIFAGEQSNTFPDGAPDLGVGGNVVTRLTESVPKNMNHKIFFDNWFNNPNLQIYLAKNGLLPLGTVRLNRVPNSEIPTAKDLKKQGRGFIVEKVALIDNIKIGITTWFENKPVNMLSTYVGSEPRTTKRRKTESESNMSLFDFKRAISEHLCKAEKLLSRKKGHPSTVGQGSPAVSYPSTPVSVKRRKTPMRHQDLPLNSVRIDNIGHMPEWQKNRDICQMC